ncbi:MAG: tetratricopeptide repeat protein [Bacteroidota bacterium]|nr:tetratricopeptide repeat protein [Bacteroidota bacterium]
MRSIRHYFFGGVFAMLTLLVGCGQQATEEGVIPITTGSDEAREYFLLGREAFEMGRSADAREYFDKALEADPAFAIAYLYRARLANSAQEWKKYTDLALEHKTGASEGEQMQIDMIPLYVASDDEAVLEQAKKLAGAYPKSPRAAMEVVYAMDGLNMTAASRTQLEAIVADHPSFAPAYRALANSFVFESPNDFGQAETYARKFVELAPQEATGHILLGDVYRAQVQLEKALEAYTEAVEVDPAHPVGYAKKGHADTFLGNYDMARADFEEAMEHSEGTAKISGANFGVYTYVYAGDFPAALNANAAVMQNIPQLIADEEAQKQAMMICYEDRCKIAAAAGDFDIARDALKAYAELRRDIAGDMNMPEFVAYTEADIAELEGWVAAMEGDFDAALASAEAAAEHLAVSKSPRKLEGVHLLKGYVARQQGDPEAALEHFAQSNDDWITVKFHTAQAEEALGNTQKAMELYREVAEWNFNGLDYALIRNKALAKI